MHASLILGWADLDANVPRKDVSGCVEIVMLASFVLK